MWNKNLPDAVTEESLLKMKRVFVFLGVMLQPLAGSLVVAVLVEPRRLVHVVFAEVHPKKIQ